MNDNATKPSKKRKKVLSISVLETHADWVKAHAIETGQTVSMVIHWMIQREMVIHSHRETPNG